MAIDTPPVAAPVYAFRCRNCLTLVEAGHAGQNDVPHSCPVCHAGVTWYLDASGQPIMELHPENWLVLADATAEELAEIQTYHMAKDEAGNPTGDPVAIERHSPFATTVTRGPDVTEEVTHHTPVEHWIAQGRLALDPADPTVTQHRVADQAACPQCRSACDVCRVNRPGTTAHVDGKTETVTNPTWIHVALDLAGAPPPEPSGPPQILQRTANDAAGSTDVAS